MGKGPAGLPLIILYIEFCPLWTEFFFSTPRECWIFPAIYGTIKAQGETVEFLSPHKMGSMSPVHTHRIHLEEPRKRLFLYAAF